MIDESQRFLRGVGDSGGCLHGRGDAALQKIEQVPLHDSADFTDCFLQPVVARVAQSGQHFLLQIEDAPQRVDDRAGHDIGYGLPERRERAALQFVQHNFMKRGKQLRLEPIQVVKLPGGQSRALQTIEAMADRPQHLFIQRVGDALLQGRRQGLSDCVLQRGFKRALHGHFKNALHGNFENPLHRNFKNPFHGNIENTLHGNIKYALGEA